MTRLFIETDVFKKTLDSIGINGLEKHIKDEILKDPSAGDIIQGTGGLRKIRVSKPGQQGKSGGFRVIYLDLPKHEVTYLILVYDKTVKENITPAQKRALKSLVEEMKNEQSNK